jgi:hypothetical protein
MSEGFSCILRLGPSLAHVYQYLDVLVLFVDQSVGSQHLDVLQEVFLRSISIFDHSVHSNLTGDHPHRLKLSFCERFDHPVEVFL